DYIVMNSLDSSRYGIAAHEYAHLFLHAKKLSLPAWLSEGLAELFSTIQIHERSTSLGGDLPARSQALRRRAWLPLNELLAPSPTQSDRDRAAIFYAQSWVLTEMLALSPQYSAQFPALFISLSAGAPSAAVLTETYHTPLETIDRDLHRWAERNRSTAIPL